MSESLVPRALKNTGESLVIEWSDGVAHELRWSELREQCPCADCRAKRAEPPPLFPILKPEEAQPVKPTAMEPVGNYAYHIRFSDGHHTGIYTLEHLRRLGEQGAA